MTSVAVVAHRGSRSAAASASSATCLARARRRRSDLVRGPEEQEGAEAGRAGDRRRRRPRVRVGRRRHGAALRRRARRHRRRRSRSSRPAPRTCSRRNLGIPKDIDEAVRIGLHGARRRSTSAVVNGERFAVMAGAGFDARMIRDADRGMKDRVGRLAYIVTGAKNLRGARVRTRIRVDGAKWFDDDASCVLVGNVGKILGGIEAFEHARPDDGRLELGVVTAEGLMQWTRALSRTALGNAEKSPFVHTTSAKRIDVTMAKSTPYELDGGDRPSTKRLKIRVEPARDRASASPTTSRSEPHEHRDAGSGDVGAHGRRRAASCCVSTGRRHLLRDAFMRLRVRRRVQPRAFARVLRLARARAGDHRVRRSRHRARQDRHERDDRPVAHAPPCPGPPASSSPPRCSRRTAAGATHRYAGLVLRARRFGHHRHDAHGSVRTGAQPPLRHRAGPPDAAEVRPRRACSRSRPGCSRCSRSSRSRSARRSVTGSTTTPLRPSGRSCAGRSRWC